MYNDKIDPFRKTIDGSYRSDVLKRKIANFLEIYNVNNSRFSPMEQFEAEFMTCLKLNLWEICFWLIQDTAYTMTAKLYKQAVEVSDLHGADTFKYALMYLGLMSGVKVWNDIDSQNENKGKERADELTKSIYGSELPKLYDEALNKH